MSLLAMNSLYNENGNNRYLWSGGIYTQCAARAIIFQRENLNYLIVCRALSVGRM